MAILWTILATVLISNCVVNAKTIFERVDDANDANSRIARFRAPIDDESLEGDLFDYKIFGCQTGNTDYENCHPATCNAKIIPIKFKRKFLRQPSVSVAISGLDVDREFNTRVKSWASNIDKEGLNLNYQAWDNTKIYGISLSWTACA